MEGKASKAKPKPWNAKAKIFNDKAFHFILDI